MNSNDLSALDSNALTKKLAALAKDEREHLVDFLRHLIEVDRRKLYAERAHKSLFAYCTDELRLSNGTAYRRVLATRLIPKYPVIADLLSEGRLSLARLALVKDVLTEENHREILQRATEGTERRLEQYVASVNPQPDVRDSIRKVPVRGAPSREDTPVVAQATRAALSPEAASHSIAPQAGSTPALSSEPVELAPAGPVAVAPSQPSTSMLEVQTGRRPSRIEIRPTSAESWAVTMSVGREFIDAFEDVKAALSHKIPNGDFEAVFMECFRVTLEAVEKRRCGSPRAKSAAADATRTVDAAPSAIEGHARADDVAATAASPSRNASIETCGTQASAVKPSRYIPAKVRHAVWKRDGGCCAFVSADGRRCGSRHQLDFHHRIPFANGGPSTEENLSLRCRTHNRYEADLAFGFDFMNTRVRDSQRNSLPAWKCGTPAPTDDRKSR